MEASAFLREIYRISKRLEEVKIFDDKEHFSDISVDTNGIVDKEIIATSRIYKNVENIGARNLITFKYNNIESNKVLDFTLSDVGLQRRGEKRIRGHDLPIFFILPEQKHSRRRPQTTRMGRERKKEIQGPVRREHA